MRHPQDYILFGSDAPWASQKDAVSFVASLKLGAEREEALLFRNAQRLLSLD